MLDSIILLRFLRSEMPFSGLSLLHTRLVTAAGMSSDVKDIIAAVESYQKSSLMPSV